MQITNYWITEIWIKSIMISLMALFRLEWWNMLACPNWMHSFPMSSILSNRTAIFCFITFLEPIFFQIGERHRDRMRVE